ncbi:phosphoethanolamine transferase [Campylobacter sp. 2014D-0216]|uniref:phosphoethanolamine transferase n=1 Tax=Campylobacter sp. 2014D-0216 TaxID=1813595 RepID=UPI0018A36E19|nr:phosphoethanolamine transferase [Campylobacter sp. 2014D-0216]QOR01008.1 sulfatase-like hydrolase/transferase [Campylobacter sp. 2014D-0216]
MQKKRYFDFVVEYFPYIFLIFILDTSISLWWSYLTFEREIYEWVIFKAIKNIFIMFVVNVFIIHLFFIFLKERTKYVVYFLTIYAVVVFILQAYLLVNYSAKFNPMFMDFFLQTNLGEIYEFMEFYINIESILACIVFLVFILACIAFFKAIKNNFFRFDKKKYYFLCGVYIFVIVALLLDTANRYFIKKHGVNSLDKVNSIFVVDIPLQIYNYYADTGVWANYNFYLKNYKKIADEYKSNKYILTKQNDFDIVFIVGESTQRNYMSLYGYDLNTTPNLVALEKKGNLIKFSDTISPFASTQASLRRVMNFSNIENEENWYDRLNIVDLFELAGYDSLFLSNHEPMSGHTSITTAVANRAKETFFLNQFATDDKIFTKALDGDMLPLIKDRVGIKDFFVIQLMGTHFKYDRRYDKSYAKFDADNINNRNLGLEEKKVVANYANAVLYNDYFINEVFNLFKDREAIIVYISDHGESVYEYRDKAEHFVTSRFTAEIPFFFIVSDKFKQNNPELLNKIVKAKDRPFMTDDLIHTMATVGGIQVKDYEESRDVLSEKFNLNRIRFFNGEADYDKILKYEKAKY